MTKFRTHIYKPNGGNLRITVEPAKPIYKDGQKVGDQPGKYADFVGGVFETNDQKVADYLKNLPTFGVDFFEVPEREDESPKSPPKSAEPELESLTKAELIELAHGKGIEVDEKLTKAEIVERIKTQ
ncbi:MAG: hypothetical protein HY006_04070 [Candidatus Sungbacteria bacterium]|nr:hypothetical protein [Candidatus Sungbacteria bacterium]